MCFRPNPFISHTSGKSARKSNHCHTSKKLLPQLLCLPHIRTPRGIYPLRRSHQSSPISPFVTRRYLVTPLECAVTSKHRVLPGFGRSCPPVTPLECAVTQIDAVTPLECALTKKVGGPPGVIPTAARALLPWRAFCLVHSLFPK